MSTVLSHSVASAAGNKVLWGAIGVLGVSTLALGAVVLRQQMGPAQPEAPLEVVAIHSPATPAPLESAQAPTPTVVPAVTPVVSDKKVPSAPAKYAQTAPKSVAKSTPTATKLNQNPACNSAHGLTATTTAQANAHTSDHGQRTPPMRKKATVTNIRQVRCEGTPQPENSA